MEIQGSKETSSLPARDFIDAADVRGIYLYRKDGYIFSYLRVLRDFLVAYQDEDMGLRTAAGKVKRRIFAAVIAITASSIIGFIKTFY